MNFTVRITGYYGENGDRHAEYHFDEEISQLKMLDTLAEEINQMVYRHTHRSRDGKQYHLQVVQLPEQQ